ncbi:MAG TPA: AtpZ/AtpI family protein [Syntrophorhabdaceae bacterium]|jgi:ATP synthase protein I
MAASDDKKDVLKALMAFGSLGLEMGLCVALGIVIGYFLDKYFGTYPYLSFSFLMIGILAAMKAVYTAAKKMEKENERDKHK